MVLRATIPAPYKHVVLSKSTLARGRNGRENPALEVGVKGTVAEKQTHQNFGPHTKKISLPSLTHDILDGVAKSADTHLMSLLVRDPQLQLVL